MSKHLIDPQVLEIAAQFNDGRITHKHLQFFIENPDQVLPLDEPDPEDGITEELIHLLPVDESAYEVFTLDAEGAPLYVELHNWYQQVTWGKRTYTKYEKIYDRSFVDGQPLYIGRRDGQETVCWGKQTFRSFERVSGLGWYEGKPYYGALIDGLWHAVWGKKVICPLPKIILEMAIRREITPFVMLGDNIAYQAWGDLPKTQEANAPREVHVLHNGECHRTYGPFTDIHQLTIMDKKLLVCGEKAEGKNNNVGYWGDQVIPHLKRITHFQRHEGKAIYLAHYQGDQGVCDTILHWGDNKSPRSSIYSFPIVANGKLLYIQRRSQLDREELRWGENTAQEHHEITSYGFDGKIPFYVASDSPHPRKLFLVYGDLRSKEYDGIASPKFDGKKLTMIARQGRRVLRVTVPRQTL